MFCISAFPVTLPMQIFPFIQMHKTVQDFRHIPG